MRNLYRSIRIPRDPLEPEVLVLARSVVGHVGLERDDLRHADVVRLEVGEHLVGVSERRVALEAGAAPLEEDAAALLLLEGQRIQLSTGVPVDR